jgi:hypothetical protein
VIADIRDAIRVGNSRPVAAILRDAASSAESGNEPPQGSRPRRGVTRDAPHDSAGATVCASRLETAVAAILGLPPPDEVVAALPPLDLDTVAALKEAGERLTAIARAWERVPSSLDAGISAPVPQGLLRR